MYIYELPYPTNKELCRLLDNDDDWRELAGVHMNYSPFDISEIEQEARRLITSPTNQLFIRWGQQNHTVESLFILLHRMVHVPAMRLLVPLLDNRFHKLLMKHSVEASKKDTAVVDENANRQMERQMNESETSIPLPVMFIENGVEMPSSSNIGDANAPSESTTENDSSYSREPPSASEHELLRSVSAIPVLSYEDLAAATGRWSERNLLGRGGFGHVYKGEWKLLPVAVKRLRDNDGRSKELIREMCLNQYRHDNILPLYGYSLGGPEACLVYQLMPGGSLEQRLRGKALAPLSWPQRHRVAHGVARGLQYLHTMAGAALIHGDIKPANILLDACCVPKIGDFGLARKGPYGDERTHLKVSRVHGTRPYLPEEYLRSRHLSPAVDVFSFGVVLLEVASALPALDRGRRVQLLSDYVQAEAKENIDFASLEDPRLKGTPLSDSQLTREFVSLGVQCTRAERRERPAMLHAYRRLDALRVPDTQPY